MDLLSPAVSVFRLGISAAFSPLQFEVTLVRFRNSAVVLMLLKLLKASSQRAVALVVS